MHRIAVLVDAGYFWVQAMQVIHGKKDSRDKMSIIYQASGQILPEQVNIQPSGVIAA